MIRTKSTQGFEKFHRCHLLVNRLFDPLKFEIFQGKTKFLTIEISEKIIDSLLEVFGAWTNITIELVAK
jgi:hypothetical protein